MNRIGIHLHISSGVDPLIKEIQQLNINALQIFSGSPRTYRKALSENKEVLGYFSRKLQEIDINPIVIHAPYLVNLGSLREDVALNSAYTLENELRFLEIINGQYLVFHAGSSRSPINQKRMLQYLNSLAEIVPSGVKLLLENNAGGDTANISYMAEMINRVERSESLGICIDTCHLYAAGYNLKNPEVTEKIFKEAQGLIKLIHLNDCKSMLGSIVDRHAHLGKGNIGITGITTFLHNKNCQDIPIILETPKDSPDADYINLSILRNILGKNAYS